MSPCKRRGKDRDGSYPVDREHDDPAPQASEDLPGTRHAEPDEDQSSPENDPSAVPKQWEDMLRRLIREELDGVLNVRLSHAPAASELFTEPPVPSEHSLCRVTRGILSQTSVDAVLLNLFEEECAKHGGSANRTMEYILWNFFGKPSLSFQLLERLIETRSARTGAVCLEDTVDY